MVLNSIGNGYFTITFKVGTGYLITTLVMGIILKDNLLSKNFISRKSGLCSEAPKDPHPSIF